MDKHYKGRANELFLHAQESNVATFNISRINPILHGVSPSGWTPKREDSLRQPLHLDASKKELERKLHDAVRLARAHLEQEHAFQK